MKILAKGNLPAHLAVIGANVIYGINYVVAKGIMPDYLQPRMIILLRVVFAALIFWLVSSIFPKEKVTRKDLLRLALCGFFGVAVNQIFFFEGLNLTTPINASIIMVGTPILVMVFSHFLLKEKITTRKMLGIALGFTGAAFLILSHGQLSFASGTFTGNIFILINASSYGLFLVLVKPLMKKYNPLTVMKWVFTFGMLYVIPVSVSLISKTDFAAIPFNIWLSIAYVILFTTILAYFLNNYSLTRISPTVNSSYIYLQPFLAAVVAILAGKDRLTWIEVIAAVLIFSGVYFVSSKAKKNGILKVS
ncbi:MAG TPA: DMT family transporter [Bacteroidales bacterium]